MPSRMVALGTGDATAASTPLCVGGQRCTGNRNTSSSVTELFGSSPDEAFNRFREILKLNGAWEPYAFIDLYEQARADEMKITVGEFVRKMQRQEFTSLLGHCFQAATGGEVTKQVKAKPRKVAPRRQHKDLAAQRDRLIRQKSMRKSA